MNVGKNDETLAGGDPPLAHPDATIRALAATMDRDLLDKMVAQLRQIAAGELAPRSVDAVAAAMLLALVEPAAPPAAGALPYPESAGSTHYDECWRERGHHNCAVRTIERQAAALRTLSAERSAADHAAALRVFSLADVLGVLGDRRAYYPEDVSPDASESRDARSAQAIRGALDALANDFRGVAELRASAGDGGADERPLVVGDGGDWSYNHRFDYVRIDGRLYVPATPADRNPAATRGVAD